MGLATVRHLFKEGTQRRINVFAGVHRKQSETSQLDSAHTAAINELKELGAHIVEIDADDDKSLDEAFNGIHKLFIIPPTDESKLHHGLQYIEAASRAKIPFVLMLSVIGAEHRHDLLGKQFLSMEAALARSGLNHTLLRVGFYQENLLLFSKKIAEDHVIPLPLGDNGCFAPVSWDDVGAAASRVLDKHDEHIGMTHNLVGPEIVNGNQIAEKASKALGQPVKYSPISADSMRQYLREIQQQQQQAAGGGVTWDLSSNEIESIVAMCDLIAKDQLRVETPVVKQILGREARFLDTFFVDFAGKVTGREGVAQAREV
ncbi:hypothetical protein HK102_005784 [Quaeritorhiza haematococci]|nr:hypothetical protein HK102_005784 [Quaeritorhiza haematococci]